MTEIPGQKGLGFDLVPISSLSNLCKKFSFMNSIEFHPEGAIFCATFFQGNALGIFRKDSLGGIEIIQILDTRLSCLNGPQHALFSRDGSKLVVSNWIDETFLVFECLNDGVVLAEPISKTCLTGEPTGLKPHGMAFSNSGEFIAVAFGSSTDRKRGIGMIKFDRGQGALDLIDLLEGQNLPAIPKGILFSPDDQALVVTFVMPDRLGIYDLEPISRMIVSNPRQIIGGELVNLARPEDIVILAGGSVLMVSNSGGNYLTVHAFNKSTNKIDELRPGEIIKNQDHEFIVPHGLGISPDEMVVAVTEFGPANFTATGDIMRSLGQRIKKRLGIGGKESRITLFRRT